MRRDGISENEAQNLVEECRAAIQDAIENAGMYSAFSVYDEVVNIMEDFLGLEPDYLEYLL